MITVDKNIPKPEHGLSIYPFAEMEVGDSFFAEDKTPNQLHNAGASWARTRGLARKWTARTVEGGARIWRAA